MPGTSWVKRQFRWDTQQFQEQARADWILIHVLVVVLTQIFSLWNHFKPCYVMLCYMYLDEFLYACHVWPTSTVQRGRSLILKETVV